VPRAPLTTQSAPPTTRSAPFTVPRAPPTVPGALPTTRSAPFTVPRAPLTTQSAPPTTRSAPFTVPRAPPTVAGAPPATRSAPPTVAGARPTTRSAPPTVAGAPRAIRSATSAGAPSRSPGDWQLRRSLQRQHVACPALIGDGKGGAGEDECPDEHIQGGIDDPPRDLPQPEPLAGEVVRGFDVATDAPRAGGAAPRMAAPWRPPGAVNASAAGGATRIAVGPAATRWITGTAVRVAPAAASAADPIERRSASALVSRDEGGASRSGRRLAPEQPRGRERYVRPYDARRSLERGRAPCAPSFRGPARSSRRSVKARPQTERSGGAAKR